MGKMCTVYCITFLFFVTMVCTVLALGLPKLVVWVFKKVDMQLRIAFLLTTLA